MHDEGKKNERYGFVLPFFFLRLQINALFKLIIFLCYFFAIFTYFRLFSITALLMCCECCANVYGCLLHKRKGENDSESESARVRQNTGEWRREWTRTRTNETNKYKEFSVCTQCVLRRIECLCHRLILDRYFGFLWRMQTEKGIETATGHWKTHKYHHNTIERIHSIFHTFESFKRSSQNQTQLEKNKRSCCL